MAANNTDSVSGDSFSGETLAALRKYRTELILQKHQLEQAEVEAEIGLDRLKGLFASLTLRKQQLERELQAGE